MSSLSSTSARPLRSLIQRASSHQQSRRHLHQRVPLPYNLDQGLDPFLSSTALHTIAVEWQQGVLGKLNQLVKDTPVEHLSVLQLVKQTAQDPSKALAFNYASEALNNSFFLSTLSPDPSPLTPNSKLASAIANSPSLRSVPGLISHFSAYVSGLHPSSGAYMWLVTDPVGNLGVIGTYAGGTPLVRQRMQVKGLPLNTLGELLPEAPEAATETPDATTPATQQWETVPGTPRKKGAQAQAAASSSSSSSQSDGILESMQNASLNSAVNASIAFQNPDQLGRQPLHPLLCLSVHEHCYLQDYGVWGREEYVRNWWTKVDWSKVEQSYAGFTNTNKN